MARILCFSGGRDRVDQDAKSIVEQALDGAATDDVIVVGDCPTGVDRLVAEGCRARNRIAVVFCASDRPREDLEGFVLVRASDWDRDGKRAGRWRNEKMLHWCRYAPYDATAMLIAIPGEGPGTRHAIEIAQALGIPVEIHEPRWPAWIYELLQEHFLLSASSYKLASRCLRRWAFKEIGRRKEPGDSATDFGKRAHAQVEAFLRDGTAPDLGTKEGRLVFESLPNLPRPGEAQVEVPFAFELDGAWFYGRIDGIHEPVKFDHKFVGSLEYAETPETLVNDPAAVLYTLAPPVFPITRLRWIYNLKKKSRGQAWSNPVEAELPILQAVEYAREHLVPAWQLLSGIRDLFAGQTPDEAVDLLEAVPCNPRDCLSYGRVCPHMSYCSREHVASLAEIIYP
jgi:hypothetical protein